MISATPACYKIGLHKYFFDYIYIVRNEKVFIIVTDVIDTVLGSISQYRRKHA